MNLKNFMIGIGFSSLLFSHSLYAAPSNNLIYKNQRGSIMLLTYHANDKTTGTLSGTFSTAVGNCKEDMNVPLPLTGFFNGNALSVTVNFPHCKQIVAMTGNLNADQSKIHTLWLDVNQADDPEGKDWNSNIVGSDIYQKIE